MAFIGRVAFELHSPPRTSIIKMSSSSAHHILSQSRGLPFLRLLVLPQFTDFEIGVIQLLLDVSWSDLRSTISCLRSIIGKDIALFTDLCIYIRDLSFSGESFPRPLLFRDLARRSIQIGKDIRAGKIKDVRLVIMASDNTPYSSPSYNIAGAACLTTGPCMSDHPHLVTNSFTIFEPFTHPNCQNVMRSKSTTF
jgi:hypothetical protein